MGFNWIEKQALGLAWRKYMKLETFRRWLPLIGSLFLGAHTLVHELGYAQADRALSQINATVPIAEQSVISSAEVREAYAKTAAAISVLSGVVYKLSKVIVPIVASFSKKGAVGLLAFMMTLPAALAGAQDNKRPISLAFETGVASTWTSGVKDERAAVIALADLPFKRGGSATRIDIAGSRGQQTVDLSKPQTFRSAEILTALYYETLGGVDAICFGGVGLSIEGSQGAPLDTRMYTGGCGTRVRAFNQSLLVGWAKRGSIQGQGFVGSLTLTKRDKVRVHIDGAMRARSLATGRRPWELRTSTTIVAWKR